MITIPMIDDDEQAVRHDYGTAIDTATRAKNYKAKSANDLGQLNWKLNQIEANWGNYAADTRASRAVLVPTDALRAFCANIKALRTTWATIQQHQGAGRILFADAIAKTGRDEILFSLDSVLTSPELTAVLSDLTAHKLRRRLPPASGPIPIAPLTPDLIQLLRQMESCLEPVPNIKGVRKVPSLDMRSDIASRLLKIIRIDFSVQAIRNAAMKKLP